MVRDTSGGHLKGYEAFFGFQQMPFSIAPDTHFRFPSASHATALAQVTYALERREPVVVVTGEIGTGKTLLCRTVVEHLARRTFLSIIYDPRLDFDDLLKQMLQDFGVISKDRSKLTPTSQHDLVHALQEFLSSLVAIQANAVVIIDEAQYLQGDVLEHIRLVSNVHDDRGSMLQIILVGQRDLDLTLSRPELRPFKQRVSRSVPLGALGPAEVERYIAHRLSVAREAPVQSNMPGAKELSRELVEWSRSSSDAPFTPEAVHAVAELSHGIPRVVNLLCDRALEAAYAQELRAVDASLIGDAAKSLALSVVPEAAPSTPVESPRSFSERPVAPARFADHATDASANRKRLGYAIAAASVVLAGAAIWFGGRASNQRATSAPASIQPAPTAPEPASTAVAPGGQVDREPPSTTATPAAPPLAKPADTAATPAESTGEGFEIVIASFRTTSRANGVAADISALGQPVRQRVSNGWQQVLAGPYASEAQAREAQQRLERAGFTNTQLVPAAR